ncbi:MAG: PAS domain-containing protein [Pseudomonadota bacterium]
MHFPSRWFAERGASPPKKARIMIVEDETRAADELKTMIIRLGYEVCATAATGREAVERAMGSNPDLAFVDIKLKGRGDGIQAALELRERTGVPAIFTAGQAEEKILERAKAAQPYGFLLKPLKIGDIKISLEMALARVRADSGLRRREEFFRQMAEFSCQWDFWVGRDGAIEYVTPACEHVTGYTRDEFMDQPDLFLEIVHPQDRELIRDHFQAHIKDPGIERLEFRIIAKDGREKWISHLCRPFFGAEGLWVGMRVNNIEITDRKKLEFELARANGRLRTIEEQLSCYKKN